MSDRKFYRGSIVKRRGWFYYRWQTGMELGKRLYKRKSLYTQDKEIANARSASYEMERCQYGDLKESKFPTFEKALKDYKEVYATTHAPRSLIQLDTAVKWLREVVKPNILNEVTRHQMQMFQAALLRGVQRSTCNNYMNYLAHFFADAHANGWTEKNAMHGIKAMELPSKIAVWFGHEEREATLVHARKTESDGVCMALLMDQDTGMRLGETVHQRMEDVDMVGGFLKVAIHFDGINGPACQCFACARQSKPGWAPGKSKKRERLIPLTPELHRALEVRARTAPTGCIVQIPERTIQKAFKRIYDGLGIPFKKVVHIWRHSLITEARKAGMDGVVTQAIAGHANKSVTEDYTHFYKAEIKREFQKLVEARKAWKAGEGQAVKFQVI